ncbi:MAG: branched chain amino acid aminotransferase, partial [Methylococcaceae bacterium]
MLMEDRDGQIWLDGAWKPWREAKVHVLTHTLHYGCGVFEGLRAYKTDQGVAVFRLQDHTDRLFRSAKILQLDMPYDKDTLNRIQREVLTRNQLDSAYIRPLCFLGSEGMGLHAANLK